MPTDKDFMYALHDQLGGDDSASSTLFIELVSWLSVDTLHAFEEDFRCVQQVPIPEMIEPDLATDIIDNIEMRKNLAQCSEV